MNATVSAAVVSEASVNSDGTVRMVVSATVVNEVVVSATSVNEVSVNVASHAYPGRVKSLLRPGHQPDGYSGENEVGKPDPQNGRYGLPGGKDDGKAGNEDKDGSQTNAQGQVEADPTPHLSGGNGDPDKSEDKRCKRIRGSSVQLDLVFGGVADAAFLLLIDVGAQIPGSEHGLLLFVIHKIIRHQVKGCIQLLAPAYIEVFFQPIEGSDLVIP